MWTALLLLSCLAVGPSVAQNCVTGTTQIVIPTVPCEGPACPSTTVAPTTVTTECPTEPTTTVPTTETTTTMPPTTTPTTTTTETTTPTTARISSTTQAATTAFTVPTVPNETTSTTTASTGISSTTNSATTTSPSGTLQRTVVFVKKVTQPGEDLFIRGGISNEQNPACTGDIDATSACAIPINVMSLGETAYYEKYNAWRVGDTRLDWFGAQAGQGSYGTTPASGTPLEWTTNDYFHPGYQPLNKYDDHMWMVDMDMDCSKGIDGWFEFKAFFQNNWEGNVNQVPCTGPATARPPFVASTNHHGRCGFINVFAFGNSSCYIDYFPTF